MLKALASMKRLCMAEEKNIGFTHEFTYTSKHHKFREIFYSLGIRKQKQGGKQAYSPSAYDTVLQGFKNHYVAHHITIDRAATKGKENGKRKSQQYF
jgi:hypothetical protein